MYCHAGALTLALWAACSHPGLFLHDSAAADDDIVVYRDLAYRRGRVEAGGWTLR